VSCTLLALYRSTTRVALSAHMNIGLLKGAHVVDTADRRSAHLDVLRELRRKLQFILNCAGSMATSTTSEPGSRSQQSDGIKVPSWP
jgi:hypothetical protein